MALKIESGDIVLIDFPFTNGTCTKVRPGLVTAVVLNDVGKEDVIIAAITSQKGFLKGIELKKSDSEFKQTGLRTDSRILPGKIFTCAKSEIYKKLGKIDDTIQKELKSKLRSIFDL